MAISTTSRFLFRSLVLAGVFSLITACGGGGGGSSIPPDTTPNAFTLSAVTDVAISTEITSAEITVAGIDAATSISITGGTYSIGGAAFTSTAGTVTNGQTVKVKLTSSPNTNTAAETVLTIGGVSATFKATTVPDVTPDAFSFVEVKDATLNSVNTSANINVAGIDVPVPISISGGTYSINGGAFTSTAGTVSAGQTVAIKLTAAAQLSTPVESQLTIGGVTASFKVTTFADTQAPTASILFPPPVSMTESNTILVRGTAKDDYSIITSVTVNGLAATTSDNFANWQVSVPLTDTTAPVTATTENTLTVVTEDSAGNKSTDAAHVAIRQAPLISSFPDSVNPFNSYGVVGVAIDRFDGRNRLLVTSGASTIRSVDLATGKRSVFTNNSSCSDFLGVAINPINKHVYASCRNSKLVDFDLAAPSQYQAHASELYSFVSSLVVDSSESIAKIYTVSNMNGTVVATDQTFTNFNVFSEAITGVPNTDNPIQDSYGIAFDKTHNRFLVLNDGQDPFRGDASMQAIVAVDAVTGARSIFSSNAVGIGDSFGAVNSTYVSTIAVDDLNQRALVAEGGSGKIFSIDLATGNRSLFSSKTTENPYNFFHESYGIAIADPKGYIFFSDNGLNAVLAVDIVTGHRVVFSK